MLTTTQKVSLPNGNHLPEGLQKAIDEYFCYLTSSKEVETTLLSMMEDALCHEDGGHVTAYPASNYIFLYRRTRELLETLESFTSKRRAELWNN